MGTKGAGGAGVLHTSGKAMVTPLLEACTTLNMFTPTVTGIDRSFSRSTSSRGAALQDLESGDIERAVDERQAPAPQQQDPTLVGLDDHGVQVGGQVLLLA